MNTSRLSLFPVLGLLIAVTACDAFRFTPPSSSSPGSQTPATTPSESAPASPAAPASLTQTLSLTTPPGGQNRLSPFFTFSTRTMGSNGDFRFILPPDPASLQISTVESDSNAVIFDLGRVSIETGIPVPTRGGETTMPISDGHVYAVVPVSGAVFGKIQVTTQLGGTVTFAYRFPVQR